MTRCLGFALKYSGEGKEVQGRCRRPSRAAARGPLCAGRRSGARTSEKNSAVFAGVHGPAPRESLLDLEESHRTPPPGSAACAPPGRRAAPCTRGRPRRAPPSASRQTCTRPGRVPSPLPLPRSRAEDSSLRVHASAPAALQNKVRLWNDVPPGDRAVPSM